VLKGHLNAWRVHHRRTGQTVRGLPSHGVPGVLERAQARRDAGSRDQTPARVTALPAGSRPKPDVAKYDYLLPSRQRPNESGRRDGGDDEGNEPPSEAT
jgi:hypothetical protein